MVFPYQSPQNPLLWHAIGLIQFFKTRRLADPVVYILFVSVQSHFVRYEFSLDGLELCQCSNMKNIVVIPERYSSDISLHHKLNQIADMK